MGKKIIQNPNAGLPPLVVLESYLNAKKKEFVVSKLRAFGLVRQEFFDRKLGHKKKDFKLKKFFGKRYRLVPAPMTETEFEQIFNLIQSLLALTPKSNSSVSEDNQSLDEKQGSSKKQNLSFSLLSSLLIFVGLAGLAGGGYASYLVFTNNGLLAVEFAAIIAASSVFFSLTLIVLARILRIVTALR
jgi:hypothetical protein